MATGQVNLICEPRVSTNLTESAESLVKSKAELRSVFEKHLSGTNALIAQSHRHT